MSERVNGTDMSEKVTVEERAVATPDFLRIFGPVLVLKDNIYSATALKPSHIVLPHSLSDGTGTNVMIFGLPVVWSIEEDAAPALIYTPKPYEEPSDA